jgi:hypothetical protein
LRQQFVFGHVGWMNDDQPFCAARFRGNEPTRQFSIGCIKGPTATIAIVQQIERRPM